MYLMARSWSGFLAQNQEVKEEFSTLHADPRKILQALEAALSDEEDAEESGASEDEEAMLQLPKRN